uniref:P-type domain-containing protein n=1 Tax=Laticauda laticaudata TaxID=8630 RepID=A0A8C5REC3_LATLA
SAIIRLLYGSVSHSGNCNVPPRRRTDCGYPGISRQTCLNRKCCFDSRYKKAKWCFYPSFSCRR